MTYWLDLFTSTTWDEFRKAGANISPEISHTLWQKAASSGITEFPSNS